MTDHKFTDEEVIKALEHYKGFRLYPFDKCEDGDNKILVDDALDLINRQKAEIEELEAECDRQYEQAEADIRANIADGGTSCHWCMDKHKTEAIKEFAERLKQTAYTHSTITGYQYPVVDVSEIDNLVQEMTGEE